MDTLIELYDERAIENILAPDMFRPQRIIYLCPGDIVRDGVNGYLVPSGDTGTMADRICRLIEETELLNRELLTLLEVE